MPSVFLINMNHPPAGTEQKTKQNKRPTTIGRNWLKPYLGNSHLKLCNYWHCVLVGWYYLMTIYHCQWDTELCVCFFNSAVIWKQLSCQVQKNFSSVKQYKKTHNEKFWKLRERVRLISRLWWLHGCGYLWVFLNLAWQFLSPLPSRCALWKTQERVGAQAGAIPPGSR